MSEIKIIYLWAEVTSYVLSTLEQLIEQKNVSVSVIHWDTSKKKSTIFDRNKFYNLTFTNKINLSKYNILERLFEFKPNIIVISAWMDKDYLFAVRKYKIINKTVKVVSGLDSQWRFTYKKIIGVIYFKIFLKKYFDYIWVSGKPQFVFAQLLGYNILNIISDLYSADSNLFNVNSSFKKRLIFVGRLEKVKFIIDFVKIYKSLPNNLQSEWPLYIVGDGTLKSTLVNLITENIHYKNYLQPSELSIFLSEGGVAILPSIHEPWGVVVHEYTCLGMPILLSSSCGASTEFLIPGFNGFIFESANTQSLYKSLIQLMSLSDNDYIQFGINSKLLSSRISPKTSAQSLLSVLFR